MPGEHLSHKQRAFLLVSLIADPTETLSLVSHFSPQESLSLGSAAKAFLERTKDVKREILVGELRRLATESRRSPLAEIHPDWLLEELKKESPRIIATVLRHLSGDSVRYILDRLPAQVLSQMPPLSQVFGIDQDLVSVLKKKFESQFYCPPPIRAIPGGLPFESLHLLPGAKLRVLFAEVGFREMAMAFGSLNQKTIDVILKRLSSRHAEILKGKIAEGVGREGERLKQAQAHLLDLDLASASSEFLILEAGLYVYSKAALSEHLEGSRLIQQKCPLVLGRLLKKYIERNLPLNSAATVAPYQAEILKALDAVEGEKGLLF